MSVGEALEQELCLKAVALLCVVTDEEENEDESNLLVAAALSKIDAGVTLLVREVGVQLLCFCSGRQGVHLLSLLRPSFHVFGRVSSRSNMQRVSIMTTADSAVCMFY